MKDFFAVTSVVASRIFHDCSRGPQDALNEAEMLYARSGWTFLETRERLILNQASRCTACGICNDACPRVQQSNPRVFQGPMDLVLRIARCAPDFRAGSEAIKRFASCSSCRSCEDICPQAIDIRAVVLVMHNALANSPLQAETNQLQQRQKDSQHDPG